MSNSAALLITYSDVQNDPRVRRQIDWLASDGWSVDTIGLGAHPSENVQKHFALQPQPAWVRTRIGGVLNYGVLPRKLRFRNLMLTRIPQEVLASIAEGRYGLIVFEEFDFLPLLEFKSVFTDSALNTHLHLDLHEYRDRRLTLNSLRRRLSDRYYRWRRSLIGHPAFNSRTTVASKIAEFYAEDFGFPPPLVVRNSPPRAELVPRDVDGNNIKLVFHGMASRARGLQEILAAMHTIDERFTVTFMLTGNPDVVLEMKALAEPFGDRVTFEQPVPMTEVTRTINKYDLEVIFLPPLWRNLEFALPNKFFEAVQGRLGVIIGESPMMTDLVNEYENGIIVDGWTSDDLARTINGITPEMVREYKAAADRAADALNAEVEGKAFLRAVTASTERSS